MMTSDTQNVFSPPPTPPFSSALPLRAGQAGRPLHHGAEGGHQDCQQGEALRIRSDEGEEPRNSASSLASIGTLISSFIGTLTMSVSMCHHFIMVFVQVKAEDTAHKGIDRSV